MPASLEIVFLSDPTPGQVEQIIALYRQAGWWSQGPFDPEHVLRIVTGSHCFVLALDGQEIVGMGRAISDRVSDAYLQDIVVKQGFRGQQVGQRMVQALLERLKADGLVWIGLTAEGGSHTFYRACGFNPMAAAVPMLKLMP